MFSCWPRLYWILVIEFLKSPCSFFYFSNMLKFFLYYVIWFSHYATHSFNFNISIQNSSIFFCMVTSSRVCIWWPSGIFSFFFSTYIFSSLSLIKLLTGSKLFDLAFKLIAFYLDSLIYTYQSLLIVFSCSNWWSSFAKFSFNLSFLRVECSKSKKIISHVLLCNSILSTMLIWSNLIFIWEALYSCVSFDPLYFGSIKEIFRVFSFSSMDSITLG